MTLTREGLATGKEASIDSVQLVFLCSPLSIWRKRAASTLLMVAEHIVQYW